jgi:hypothetical protein
LAYELKGEVPDPGTPVSLAREAFVCYSLYVFFGSKMLCKEITSIMGEWPRLHPLFAVQAMEVVDPSSQKNFTPELVQTRSADALNLSGHN